MNIYFKRCGSLYWLVNRENKQALLYGLGALWLPFLERGCAEHIIRLLCRVRLFKSNKILGSEEIPVCDLRPEAPALPRSLTEMQTDKSHQPTWTWISKGECRNLFHEALPGESNVYWSLRFLRHHRTSLNRYEMCRGTSAIFQGTVLISSFFFWEKTSEYWADICVPESLILPVWSSHKQVQSVFLCWDVR